MKRKGRQRNRKEEEMKRGEEVEEKGDKKHVQNEMRRNKRRARS